MKDTQRVKALWEDVLDYQDMLGKAQDAKDQGAADTFQELIDEDKRFIDIILGVDDPLVTA